MSSESCLAINSPSAIFNIWFNDFVNPIFFSFLKCFILSSLFWYLPIISFVESVEASSTIKNLKAMVNDEGIATHSPGPNGLPGGYPVILDAKGAKVNLPDEISLKEAISINEDSGRLDSIEKIKNDGTVVFAGYAYEIMKDALGFDCRSFKPDESKNLAFEQMARFKELSNRYNN